MFGGWRRAVRRAAARVAGQRQSAPPPPRCPEGWRTGGPDFVGIGAMKAGTSWWYALVVEHPDAVDVPGRPKEVHYFDRFSVEEFSPEDREGYAAFFPRPSGRLVGEWTPRYMHDFATPALLADCAPDAKLLVLLRDPVERFISGVTHETTRGWPATDVMLADHFARGVYVDQLERVAQSYSRDKLLVLQYERCVASTRAAIATTYEFLGLDRGFAPPSLDRRINETSGPPLDMSPATRRRLVDAYRPSVDRLVAAFPDLEVDLDLWPNFTTAA